MDLFELKKKINNGDHKDYELRLNFLYETLGAIDKNDSIPIDKKDVTKEFVVEQINNMMGTSKTKILKR